MKFQDFLLSIGIYNVAYGLLHLFSDLELMPEILVTNGIIFIIVAVCLIISIKDDVVKQEGVTDEN